MTGSQDEVLRCHCGDVHSSQQDHHRTDCDAGVGPNLGPHNGCCEVRHGDAHAANIDNILSAGWVGVESNHRVGAAVTEPGSDDVVAGARGRGIDAAAATNGVGAGITGEGVVSGPAVDPV